MHKTLIEPALGEAIRIKPDISTAHYNLGVVFQTQGKHREAINAYREAIRIKLNGEDGGPINYGLSGPDFNRVISTIQNITINPSYESSTPGLVRIHRGKAGAAIEAFHKSVRYRSGLAEAYYDLGISLYRAGKTAEAIAAFREALRNRLGLAEAHYNLGVSLYRQRKFGEAIAAFREAIRIKPYHAEAHCNLGLALQSQAQFAEALAELRMGHNLGWKRPGWSHPSERWVEDCEMSVALEPRLPALLRGDDSPKDNAERLSLGQLCQDMKRFAASARFRGDALTDDPKLADDRKAQHSYDAACSAALAGTGQGKDDPKPDDAARAKLRQQARDWLRDELSAWEKVAMTDGPGNKPLVVKALEHWKTDADLAGVRDAQALAKLPEDERKAWRVLWASVDSLLAKVVKP
ncbi:MAG: serine/threonine protein kinase [Planctomycetota bacterium]|nr:serine/threonine protein kinase [Planctomycetota bacterium]